MSVLRAKYARMSQCSTVVGDLKKKEWREHAREHTACAPFDVVWEEEEEDACTHSSGGTDEEKGKKAHKVLASRRR